MSFHAEKSTHIAKVAVMVETTDGSRWLVNMENVVDGDVQLTQAVDHGHELDSYWGQPIQVLRGIKLDCSGPTVEWRKL